MSATKTSEKKTSEKKTTKKIVADLSPDVHKRLKMAAMDADCQMAKLVENILDKALPTFVQQA